MHLCFIGRITNPPVLIGRTFFYCGLQIRRDAWRWTFWNRQALSSARRCLPSGVVFRQALSSVRRCLPLGVPPDLQSGVKKCSTLLFCGFAIRLSNSLFHSSHHSLLSESIFFGFNILEAKSFEHFSCLLFVKRVDFEIEHAPASQFC